jgi:hypothetical protein
MVRSGMNTVIINSEAVKVLRGVDDYCDIYKRVAWPGGYKTFLVVLHFQTQIFSQKLY